MAAHGSPATLGNLTWQAAVQLDETVTRNKNLKDAQIVENWIRKSQQIMEKMQLAPLPDMFGCDSVPSETGTDYSAAFTLEHEQVFPLDGGLYLCVL